MSLKKILVAVLTFESRLILKKYKPFIVAVTGSVGKTTTKDAIFSVLKEKSRYVRKSEKSLNSEIGLPLSIIGAPNAWHSLSGWLKNIWRGKLLILMRKEYPDCLILEIGADHPGDIKRIVSWLKPDIAVITKVSDTPVHVEFFKSPAEVFEEKALLASAVKPGGALVLFGDDKRVAGLGSRINDEEATILTYGTGQESNVKGSGYSVTYEGEAENRAPVGFSFKIELNGKSSPITVRGIIGDVYEYPLLAAATVGTARDVPLDAIVRALSAFEAPHGRMNLIAGIHGSTIIDDSYNSSPDAAISALQSLKSLECPGRKFAVLGDMMELGKYSVEEHHKIGREAAAVAAELFTVGPRSRATAAEASRAGLAQKRIHSFETSAEAAPHVASIVRVGDIVLVKGSQAARMERVVKALLREPEKSAELLVRQEKEWLDKP